jgi:autotransporter adhesin
MSRIGLRSTARNGAVVVGTAQLHGAGVRAGRLVCALREAISCASRMGTRAGQNVTASNTVSIGTSATASQTSAIAIGTGAIASGTQSISIGTGNTVSGNNSGALGDPSTVSGNNSYSVGNNNTIAQDNTFVIGNSVVTTQANAVVLGNNSADRAAAQVNTATVGNSAGGTITYSGFAGTASGVASVGAAGAERQIINVAPGAITSTSTDAINGSQLYSVANGLDNKIINVANGITTGGVRYDINNDGTTNYNSVTLGGQNATSTTALHNVSAGVAGTDAVNVNQLNGAVGNLNGRINALDDKVNANTKMLSGGVAAAAAMAVVTPVEPGRYHVSGAVAGYNGQAGVGFNVLKRSDNGQTTLHAGVGWATGGSKAIVRVGFGFSFD